MVSGEDEPPVNKYYQILLILSYQTVWTRNTDLMWITCVCIFSRKLSGKPRHVSAKGLEKYQGFFSVRPGSYVLLFHSYLRSSQPSMLKVWLDALPKAIVLDPCLVQLTPEWLFLSTGSSTCMEVARCDAKSQCFSRFPPLECATKQFTSMAKITTPILINNYVDSCWNHTNNSLTKEKNDVVFWTGTGPVSKMCVPKPPTPPQKKKKPSKPDVSSHFHHLQTLGLRSVDHCVECLCSLSGNPYSDGLAVAALSLLVRGLRGVQQNPSDMEARSQCQLGIFQAGGG